MRLLQTRTLKFEEFFDNAIPEYAILSHTWGAEEVSFQDALRITGAATRAATPAAGALIQEDLACKAGWDKIKRTCSLALEDNLEYAWVDTCCIDKTSSAELSEAINSMFRWYESSKVCYAYLADVSTVGTFDPSNPSDQFKASRWFTRGWTLQELLAPSNVIFFASDWTYMATRHELAAVISPITGIRQSFLQRDDVSSTYAARPAEPAEPAQKRLWDVINLARSSLPHVQRSTILGKLRGSSIAERMSWAAKRQTTRLEDTAYCLLGLFEIHMPLIYGEGPRAFIRLQEEIMRKSDDMTILAWNFRIQDMPLKPIRYKDCLWQHPWKMFSSAIPYGNNCRSAALLAESPASFLGCENIVPSEMGSAGSPPTLSSKGLSTNLPLSDDKHPHIVLPCRLKDDSWHLIALPLISRGSNSYARAHMPSRLLDHHVWHRWKSASVNLLTTVDEYDSRPQVPEHSFWVRDLPDGFELGEVHPRATYGLSERIIVPNGAPFSEQPIGGKVTASIHLINQNKDGGQDFFIILHVAKLYKKGIGWARPVRTNYKIVPCDQGRPPQSLALLVTDEVPCESLQYGTDSTDQGLLYATIERQICFGKPLFVVDVKYERRSLQGRFLRKRFDLVATVNGRLRDYAESRPLVRSLVALIYRAVLCWEAVVRTSIVVVIIGMGSYMTWVFYQNYDGPPAKIRSWMGWLCVSGIFLALTLMMYEIVPFLSLSFPRLSSVIRTFRFPLALISLALVLSPSFLTRPGIKEVDFIVPLVFLIFILYRFMKHLSKEFF
jgi:hypothetical protein